MSLLIKYAYLPTCTIIKMISLTITISFIQIYRSKLCIPHLKKSKNAHILNISPPFNMNPNWFKDHVAYTMAKYGMSMCVLGMATEFKVDKIAVNALWPRTGNKILL